MISTQSHTEDREFYELNAYGFSLSALKLIHNYLPYRKQRIQIENFYSRRFELIFGEPQGSILRPLLFNIFLINLFFILMDKDIANFSDGNTSHNSKKY